MSKTGIEIVDTTYWKWVVNHDCPEEKLKLLKEEAQKEFHGCIGKYLFFSKDRKELIELAEMLLPKYELHHAKVPSSLREGHSEYVLCVYDVGPNLIEEMKQYKTETIKYRYWKSDEATMKGIEQHEL